MKTRHALVTCLGLALSLALAATALAADAAPATKAADPAAKKADAGVGEAISLERAARKQWLDLIQAMTQVAKELEKSEPDSARVIAGAAQKAQEALIGDDMAKVIQFLEDGMIVPADATQSDIIKKLKDVLETLRGGDMRLKDRLERIAAWKQFLKEIDKNLQQQKELEEHSRQVAFGEEQAKDLENLANEVKELAAKERDIAKATDGLAADPNLKKLIEAREAVRAVLRKQDALGKVTESAGAGQMALASEAQKALGTETGKVKDSLGELAKDAPLARAMEDASVKPNAAQVAAESAGKAGGEMQRATAALDKAEAPAATTAQGTASAHLRDAEKALSDAIDKMGGKKPSGELAAKQTDLKKKADEVAAKVDKATGAQPSEKPNESGQPSPKNNVAKAAEHMGKAAEYLKDQDQPSALDREKKAVDSLEAQAKDLQKKAGDVREAMKNPDHPGQKGKQDELAKQSKDLASKMQGKPSDQPSQPAPGQPSVQKASENQQQAAQNLGQQKPPEANKDQNEAEKNLEDAKKELADAIQKEQDAAQEQALAQVEVMLRKILESQKRLSTGTKDTQVKAKPDGKFERTESVRLADLADGEGKLAEDTQGVAKLLDDEGTTVVFPTVLRDVREDMARTQELLASLQPGALTQGIQKEIEDRLQEMIDALQKEMSDRRQKDQQKDKNQGKPQKQPLVPPIAELKMLRSLQVQINGRTVLLNQAGQASQASPEALKLQHKVLSDRQNTVSKMTRDLAETLKQQQ